MLGVGVAGPLSPEDEAAPRYPSRVSPAADERDAWAVLAGVRGLGPVGFGALLRRYGSGRAILREAASPGGIERLADTTLDEAMSAEERPPRSLAIGLATAIADAGEHAGADARPDRGARPADRDDRGRRLPAPAGRRRDAAPRAVRARRAGCAGRQGSRGHRRDAPRHRCRPAHRRPDRRRPRGRRRQRDLGAGGRHRRRGARGGGPRPRHDRGRHRIRPRRSPPACPRTAGGVDRRGRWRDRVRARTRRRPEPRHIPASQPDHQRARRRDRRRRGAGPQRRADHRVVGARAGSRVLPRPGRARRSGLGRLSCVPARVPGRRAHRGRDPAADRRPRPGRSPDRAGRPGQGGRHAGRRGRRGRPDRTRARARPRDRRRARGRDRLAGRERAGGLDAARAPRPGGRFPRSFPAGRAT